MGQVVKYDRMTQLRAQRAVMQHNAGALSSVDTARLEAGEKSGHGGATRQRGCRCVIVQGDDASYDEAMHPDVPREDWCPIVGHRQDSLERKARKRRADALMRQLQRA